MTDLKDLGFQQLVQECERKGIRLEAKETRSTLLKKLTPTPKRKK